MEPLPPCCEELWQKAAVATKAVKDWLDPDIQAYFKHIRGHDKSHVGNGAYNGPFAFTLTKSPTDSLTTADMIKAAQKLCSQKSCPVVKYAWYLEYGQDNPDHPHIHGMYLTTTGGRIEAKHFKRAWPIWNEKSGQGAGFRGGYHRPVRHEECYSEYIAKDGGIGESSGLGSQSDPSPTDNF